MAHGVGLIGRADLLTRVRDRLSEGADVVLCGPTGIGKSALLDVIALDATARGETVLRTTPTEADRGVPFVGLADLLADLPGRFLDALPEPQRLALGAALLRCDAPAPESGQLALRLAVRAVLERCAAAGRVLLVLDDVQWLDPATADAVSFALHRLRDTPVRAVMAERVEDGGPTVHCAPEPVEIAVPPLPPDSLVDLLEAHGLPCRAAAGLHMDSGGNPYLALALCHELAGRQLTPWHAVPLPDRVRTMLRRRVAELPSGVRQTLLVAALATRPTVGLLLLAGRAHAEQELRTAATNGLVALAGGTVRFTPGSIAAVLVDDAPASACAAVHSVLSTVATDPVEQARHRAMSTTGPDADAADALADAARSARGRGARALAAELLLLAAERTPPDAVADRMERLLRAAETGAAAGRSDLVDRAAGAVLAAPAEPGHRVRARLAQCDVACQSLGHMGEPLALASSDAGDDPGLLAPVQLRLAWRSLIAEGSPRGAREQAIRCLASARAAGDAAHETMALSMLAQLERILGLPSAADRLREALAVDAQIPTGWLFLSPHFAAARHALFDDRLDAARTELLGLLAEAQRQGGDGEETIEILRSLAEVSARAGRCREALDQAERAMRISDEVGLSPGKCWYTAAVAELAGGSFTRALALAERVVRASEEEQDQLFVSRGLYAVGMAKLRAGDPPGAVGALRRVREIEAGQGVDVAVLRWHSELAMALVATGAVDEAVAVVAEARGTVDPTHSVSAMLDRAEAAARAERGDAAGAVLLLAGAAARFAALGLPIEHGYTLLTLARAERRRRRYAASRAALREALAVFTRVDARPWVDEVTRSLSRMDGGAAQNLAPAAGPAPGATGQAAPAARTAELTATEARIAALVREGASNREIAARLFLSVKTVEATLTRIYRKLDVRSRTQLTTRLPG